MATIFSRPVSCKIRSVKSLVLGNLFLTVDNCHHVFLVSLRAQVVPIKGDLLLIEMQKHDFR